MFIPNYNLLSPYNVILFYHTPHNHRSSMSKTLHFTSFKFDHFLLLESLVSPTKISAYILNNVYYYALGLLPMSFHSLEEIIFLFNKKKTVVKNYLINTFCNLTNSKLIRNI